MANRRFLSKFKVFLIVAVIVGFCTGAIIAVASSVPSVAELKKQRSLPGTKVYAIDNTLIGEFKIDKGIYVPLKRIPKDLKNAVIAVEDSRFYKHKGIDYIGIARAIVKDIMHLRLKEGASTISQQLARLLFLSSEKTLTRKLKEANLALKLEQELSKDEILEMYLNRVYLGHGAYGVEMASRIYFGKSVEQINLPEAAILAGLLKAPSTYSPYNDLVRAKERQDVVLMRMEEEGYITPKQRQLARQQPVKLSSLKTATDAYNYFLEYVRQHLERTYGVEKVYYEGFKVYTTLDKHAQVSAQKALQDGLRAVDKRRGFRGPISTKHDIKLTELPEDKLTFQASQGDIATGIVLSVSAKEATVKSKGIIGRLQFADAQWACKILDKKTFKQTELKNCTLASIIKKGDVLWVKFKTVAGSNVTFALEQEPEVEGAIAAVEPETGYIKALVGGFSITRGEFNRAVSAKRQPGSAFKPFIYGAGLEYGLHPATIVVDEPVEYSAGSAAGLWRPENYDRKYYGPTRLRTALAFSRNVVTVKLVEMIGIDRVLRFVRDIGIETALPRDFTIALGSTSMSPLDMAMAYSVFANGGVKMNPIFIRYIEDYSGNIIAYNDPEGQQAISEQTAFLLTSMLKDVITYGTGMRANIGRPAAGKTGTSNDYKDAWFVGYTPQLSAAVWVGYDEMRRSLGQGEVGGRASAPIWADFMRSALAGEPVEDFAIPPDIIKLKIDPTSGLLVTEEAEGIYEYFRVGHHPTTYAEGTASAYKPPKLEQDFD